MNVHGVVGKTAVHGNVDASAVREAPDVQPEELRGEEVDLELRDKKEEGVLEDVMPAKTSHLGILRDRSQR